MEVVRAKEGYKQFVKSLLGKPIIFKHYKPGGPINSIHLDLIRLAFQKDELSHVHQNKLIHVGNPEEPVIRVDQYYNNLYHICRDGKTMTNKMGETLVSRYGSNFESENEVVGKEIEVKLGILLQSATTYNIFVVQNIKMLEGIPSFSSDLTISLKKEGLRIINNKLLRHKIQRTEVEGGGCLIWNKEENCFILSSYPLNNGQETFKINLDELQEIGIDGIPEKVVIDEPIVEVRLRINGKEIDLLSPSDISSHLRNRILNGKPMIPVAISVDGKSLMEK